MRADELHAGFHGQQAQARDPARRDSGNSAPTSFPMKDLRETPSIKGAAAL